MLEGLTRDNLHGIWAAVPTPFDEAGRIDVRVLRENVRRLHAARLHGVYTTDSDGASSARRSGRHSRSWWRGTAPGPRTSRWIRRRSSASGGRSSSSAPT
jgi:hypothetical protein